MNRSVGDASASRNSEFPASTNALTAMAPASTARTSSPPTVQTALRVRPFIVSETRNALPIKVTKTKTAWNAAVTTKDKNNNDILTDFPFHHIFLKEATQNDLYTVSVQPHVEAAFNGYNVTILAYGQTGAGKTYVMGFSGADITHVPVADRGVPVRFLYDLFPLLEAAGDEAFEVAVSHMEVVGNDPKALKDLNDLNGTVSLAVKEKQGGRVFVENLTKVPVKCAEDAANVLRRGCLCRLVAETEGNATSSRTHSIFCVYVSRTISATEKVCSKVSFVDLAGSEKCTDDKVTREQGILIKKDLLVLGNVVDALAQKSSHVPYSSRALTRILKNDLGGNARATFIACVSPAEDKDKETMRTLEFANRAMKIKTRVTQNVVKAAQSSRQAGSQELAQRVEDVSSQLQTVQDQAAQLRSEAVALREDKAALTAQVSALQVDLEEEIHDSRTMYAELSRLTIRAERKESQLAELRAEAERKESELAELRAENEAIFTLWEASHTRDKESLTISAGYQQHILELEAILRERGQMAAEDDLATKIRFAATEAVHRELMDMAAEDLRVVKNQLVYVARVREDERAVAREQEKLAAEERANVRRESRKLLPEMMRRLAGISAQPDISVAYRERAVADVRAGIDDFRSNGGTVADLKAVVGNDILCRFLKE